MKEKLNIENLDDSDSQKFDENTYEKIELIFSFFKPPTCNLIISQKSINVKLCIIIFSLT